MNAYERFVQAGCQFTLRLQARGPITRDEVTAHQLEIIAGWLARQQRQQASPAAAAPPTRVDITTLAQLAQLFQALPSFRRVGFDVETARAAGLSDADEARLKTALDPHRCRLRLLQLAVPGTVYVVDCFALPDLSWLALVFAQAQQVIGHNLEFDLRVVGARGIAPPDGTQLCDTLLLDALLTAGDRTARHGLGVVVERWLGFSLDKTEQRSDWSVPSLSEEQLHYAALDAQVLLPLAERLEQQVALAGLERVAALEHEALPMLATMRLRGVALDRAQWLTLARQAEAECDQAERELATALGVRLLPKTPEQLRALYAEHGFVVAPDQIEAALGARFKLETQRELQELSRSFGFELPREALRDALQGRVNLSSPKQLQSLLEARGHTLPNVDEDTLKTLGDDEPLVPLLLRLRSALKRATTYGEEYLQRVNPVTGRIHADWRQLGTETGRMSAGDGLQQIPHAHAYRAAFAAPPGRVLIKADYSQIELRIAAVVFRDQRMLAAYQAGEDLHKLTAALVLDKDIAEVTKDDRQIAKSLNFGLLYGMGAEKLQIYARTNYGVQLTLAEAQAFRAKWLRAYSGVQAAHKAVAWTAVDTRTLAGRRRLRVERYSEKLNTPIQGTGADGLKVALGRLWRDRARFPTAWVVLVVHDEIVVECDAAEAAAVRDWLVAHMVAGMGEIVQGVPIEVEAQLAQNWAGDPLVAPVTIL